MTGMICGTGSCVPHYVLENEGLSKMVDTSDEWIRERTGVERRHIIREETTVSMAAEAGRRALEDAGIQPEELDAILVSTISSNMILPGIACEVQRLLGAVNAFCFVPIIREVISGGTGIYKQQNVQNHSGHWK